MNIEEFTDKFYDLISDNIDDIVSECLTGDSNVVVDYYLNLDNFNFFSCCECSSNYSLSPGTHAIWIYGKEQNLDKDMAFHQCYGCCVEEEFENGEISEEEYNEQRRECEDELGVQYY